MMSFACKLLLASLAFAVGTQGEQVCTTSDGIKCLTREEAGPYAQFIPAGQPDCFKKKPDDYWSYCFYQQGSGSQKSCSCVDCVSVTANCKNNGYQCFGAGNTMNKYCSASPATCAGKNVVSATISASDKATIVNKHNELRRKLAMGQQKDYYGQTISGVKNMNKLVYNEELAVVAQRWADQCEMGHDKDRRSPNFKSQPGQNAYITSVTSGPWAFAQATQRWYDEVGNFTKQTAANFQSGEDLNSMGVVGHFTQVVRADATKVGCGIKVWTGSDSGQLIVCNYDKGNMIGTPTYLEGATASACTKGSTNGLCNV